MRTTITVDDDVLKQIEVIAAREKRSRRDVLNETLRRGIAAREVSQKRPEADPTEPRDLGRCLLPSLDNVGDGLSVAERDDYR